MTAMEEVLAGTGVSVQENGDNILLEFDYYYKISPNQDCTLSVFANSVRAKEKWVHLKLAPRSRGTVKIMVDGNNVQINNAIINLESLDANPMLVDK